MERRNSNTGILVITTAIVALLLGGVIGWMLNGNYNTSSSSDQSSGFIAGIGGGPVDASSSANTPNFYSDVSNFRVRLNSLFTGHAVLGSDYLINQFDGKDISALKPKIDENSTNIANEIGNFYGDNAKNQFLNMWNKHLVLYSQYTLAAKSGDNSKKQNSKQLLYSLTNQMGEMMHSFDSNFDQQTVTNLMNEHVNLTLAIVDAHASADNQGVVNNKSAAFEQAGKVADYFGQVMSTSQPDKAK